MSLKNFLTTKSGAIWAAIVLTVIVLLESLYPPWAPYFIVYAALAIAIPLWIKTPRFGSIKKLKEYWKAILIFFLVLLIWEVAASDWLYEAILKHLGLGQNPFWSITLAVDQIANAAAIKFGISKNSALLLYGGFFLLWAPIGEELFYRGYLQEILRRDEKGCGSFFIPAFFFGIRHATHFFFLWPSVSLGAALVWSISAFVSGLILSTLYEGTRSLWPAILLHFLVNLVAFSIP